MFLRLYGNFFLAREGKTHISNMPGRDEGTHGDICREDSVSETLSWGQGIFWGARPSREEE